MIRDRTPSVDTLSTYATDRLSERTQRAIVLYASVWVGLLAFWMVVLFDPNPTIGTLRDEVVFALVGPAIVATVPALVATAAIEYLDL